MKNKKFMVGILIVMFVFGVMFTGCEETAEVYKVYVDSFLWTASDPDYSALDDFGYKFIKLEDEAEFNAEIAANYKNKTPFDWTKDDIVNYLVEKGFSESKATIATDAFLSTEHGILGFRVGTNLTVLCK